MRTTGVPRASGFWLVTVVTVSLAAAGFSEPEHKTDLNILFAGNPASSRTGDFVEFLSSHFTSVETTDLATLTEEHAHRYDVAVLDHDAGRPPLVRKQAMNRRCAFHYRAFSPDLVKKYEGREDELYQLCKDNVELLRYEQRQLSANTFEIMFPIDSELKELGIASNRRISTLERLIGLLAPERASSQPDLGFFERLQAKRRYQKQAKTARRRLTRYTGLDFKTHEQWRQWLDEHRARLFFSDFGGYQFYVIPEGYPAVSAPDATKEPFWFPR